MPPCQRNTAEISRGVNPIEKNGNISVFSITMIAKTLKMPSPERRRILDTVIADEARRARNTSSQTFSDALAN